MLFILKSQFFKVGMSFVITTRKMRNLIPQTLSVSPPSGVWMEATVLGVTQNFIVLMLGFLTANAVRYLPPIAVIYIFSLVRYLHLGTLSVVFRADGCLRPLAFFFFFFFEVFPGLEKDPIGVCTPECLKYNQHTVLLVACSYLMASLNFIFWFHQHWTLHWAEE